MNLQEAAANLGSLRTNLAAERKGLCVRSIQKGHEIAQEWDIAIDRRVRRRRRMPGERACDAGLTMEEELSRVIKLELDTLAQEIDVRSTRLQDLNSCFEFLPDINSLLSSEREPEELFQQCADFGLEYEGDVNGASLHEEIVNCRMLFKRRQQSALQLPSSADELLKATIRYGKDSLPKPQDGAPNTVNCVSVGSQLREIFQQTKIDQDSSAVNNDTRTPYKSCNSLN